MAAEPYSQGNANYRDVNQNRRCDVLLEPEVGAFNVLSFLGLIQADGYNPLVVEGSRFTLPAERRAAVLALVEQPEGLEPLLAQPFTPGQLLRAIADEEMELKVSPEVLVTEALTHAEQHFQATHGEGYWIDHWIYNLDLIETYLAVYPDRKGDLLFGGQAVSFFDSPAVVQPRARKYVLTGDGQVRQYGAVVEDEEKAALIAARIESPNLVRTAHGRGEVYRTTVFAKLVGLALLKFATLDPLGYGRRDGGGQAGLVRRPQRAAGPVWLVLVRDVRAGAPADLPAGGDGGRGVSIRSICPSSRPSSWSRSSRHCNLGANRTIRIETFSTGTSLPLPVRAYRARVRLGFGGERENLPFDELRPILAAFRAKVRAGIQRAVEMNDAASRRPTLPTPSPTMT